MSKSLHEMPASVRQSAWCNSHAFGARVLQKVDEYGGMGWFLLIYTAWWVPGYWLLVAPLPFEWTSRTVAPMRAFTTTYFVAMLLATFALHWFAMVMRVPRADPSYPLVANNSDWLQVARRLAMFCTFYAVVLWLASVTNGYHVEVAGQHYFHAAYASIAAGGTWALVLRPPTLGFNVPSDADMHQALTRTSGAKAAAAVGSEAAQDDYVVPVQARKARHDFSRIHGMQAVKDKLLDPGRVVVAARASDADTPANGMLLHGEPGNGKTVFAEALAGELQVPFIEVTYGDVSSKWLGETPKVISRIFAYARQQAPCVLFFDEFDSLAKSRDSGSNNAEDQKIANVLLTEIVKLRDARVVLMAATNFLAQLDAAAIREGRFDYKVEITPPDEPARIGLLRDGMRKHGAGLAVDDNALTAIARRWNGFSVSRLQAVARELPGYAKQQGVETVGYDHWVGALRAVQGRAGKVPPNTKGLSELVLDSGTRAALELIAGRLQNVHRLESRGGTLPGGILMHGPSGTGKTAAAKALAKASGWSFIYVGGSDLTADRGKITKLFAEAKDLRPALLFIDEADDVLRARQMSNTSDLTNRLLVLMDGGDEQVKDVIVVAATNHPEDVDSALLRRFTEKIEFLPPPQDLVPRHVSGWLKAKNVMLAPGLDPFEISARLEGQTVASIDSVLQYALNSAINRTHGDAAVIVTGEDISLGKKIVLGQPEGSA